MILVIILSHIPYYLTRRMVSNSYIKSSVYFKFVFLTSLIIFGIFLFMKNEIPSSGKTEISNIRRVLVEQRRRHKREILFYGDSLVAKLNDFSDVIGVMKERLEETHSQFEVQISLVGNSGDTVADLHEGRKDEVVNRHWRLNRETRDYELEPDEPDAVIVYWDSDMKLEKPDWDEMQVETFRLEYKEKLYALLKYLNEHIRFVALAGPGLSGELEKNTQDQLYDDYETMNKNIAVSIGIPYIGTLPHVSIYRLLSSMCILSQHFIFFYIDIRTYLKQQLPKGWNKVKGFLSIDGYLLNQKGHSVVRDSFVDQINDWTGMWTVRREDLTKDNLVADFIAPPRDDEEIAENEISEGSTHETNKEEKDEKRAAKLERYKLWKEKMEMEGNKKWDNTKV